MSKITGSQKGIVLVVTQDNELAKAIEQLLKERWGKVTFALNVKQFFEILAREGVDLIVFDSHIPPLDSLEAFSVARVYYPNIPAILVDNQEKFEEVSSILERGFVFRMSKPFDKQYFDEVSRGIRKQLNNNCS